MILRNALPQDAPQLLELLIQLSPKYEMTLSTLLARISAFDNNNHQIFVAEHEGVLVGALALACYEQFRLPGKCYYIDTLIVDKNHRGNGIGKQLLLLAEQYAQEHGGINIELSSSNYRRKEGTHAFYASFGYQTQEQLDFTFFSKRVRPAQPAFNLVSNADSSPAPVASGGGNAAKTESFFKDKAQGEQPNMDAASQQKNIQR